MNYELLKLIRETRASYEAMTEEERRQLHLAHRKSWVIGEMMIKFPELSREEAEAIYDKVAP